MSDAVISALITGGLALLGVVLTCYFSNQKTKDEIKDEHRKSIEEIKTEFKVQQAVTNTKIEQLTREVHKHNNFAKRMPVVENEIKHIHEDVDNLKHYHEN